MFAQALYVNINSYFYFLSALDLRSVSYRCVIANIFTTQRTLESSNLSLMPYIAMSTKVKNYFPTRQLC